MIRIAFIDSVNSTRELYAHLLEAAGYRVLQATTAQYGIQVCRTMAPDLIITTRDPVDAELEDEDFVSVLRRVAGLTPIIVVEHGNVRSQHVNGNVDVGGSVAHGYVEMMGAIHRALNDGMGEISITTARNGVSAVSS